MSGRISILMLISFLLLPIVSVRASEVTDERFQPASTLADSVEQSVEGTNFNGSVMISRNNGDEYDVIYQDALGSEGGYDVDTVYDIGSVSKLFTTIGIMKLEEAGQISYDDTLDKFFSQIPEDKAKITIEMLLTHTSGLSVPENEDHTGSREDELKRIFKSDLSFEPGTNYLYANSGFTMLAAVIEKVTGLTYEDYMHKTVFDEYGMDSTGFPLSDDVDSSNAVEGTLDGESYGNVTQFEYGWWSKGYTDVLSTPRDLTNFFQQVIAGDVIDSDNLKLFSTSAVDLGTEYYRGFGTDIKHEGTDQEIIGHTGIWYGGNTVVYYRPSDNLLFVLACDELDVTYDLPANYVFNTLNGMYESGALDVVKPIETVSLEEETIEPVTLAAAEVKSESTTPVKQVKYLENDGYLTGLKTEISKIVNYGVDNYKSIIILIIAFFAGMTGYYLVHRIRSK